MGRNAVLIPNKQTNCSAAKIFLTKREHLITQARGISTDVQSLKRDIRSNSKVSCEWQKCNISCNKAL